MVVLLEADDHLELGCTVCRDNKILSTQVITRPKGWDRARWQNEINGVEKAKQIQRTQTGRIRYFT